MAVYRINNIKYDVDGRGSLKWLPKTLNCTVDDGLSVNEIEEALSDHISDTTGFCHNGFTFEKLH